MDDPRWQRLQAFEFDEPEAAFPFSARLARENGWTLRYTERVLEEYKRYVYLCCTAEHIACPSEAVDQAWHLHLTYTRSYWHELCGEVLGRPLHHGPTRGGAAEHVKHVTLYEQTLASYRRVFGSEPPRDIWPPAEERFGVDTRVRRVNVARCWVIPKPRWPRWLVERRRALAGSAATALVPVTFAAFNPFDLSGPEFLQLYFWCLLTALLGAVGLRYVLRKEDTPPAPRELDPYEFACLRENERLAINVALARLVQRDALHIEPQIKKILGLTTKADHPITALGQPANDLTPLERAVWKAAQGGATFGDLQSGAMPEAQRIAEKLAEEGLLLTPAASALARFLPVGIMLMVLAFGLVKAGIGFSRGQPILFLLGFCGMALVALILLARQPRRTHAGDAWVKQYQQRYQSLANTKTQLAADDDGIEGSDLMWAVALGGVAVLAAGPYHDLHAAWTTHYRDRGGPFSGWSSGCSGCNSWSSGCGGGDSGCGGGCGGCGGD